MPTDDGPTPDELAAADAVSAQLIRVVRLMDRAHARYQAAHPDAIERATYHLLVQLVKCGPQRSSALAEAVHSDPSTVSRQVAHLVRLGLVARAADPADGRATLVAATDEGRRVFEQNRRVRIERVAAMLTDWTPDERRTFAAMLGRFATAFELHKLPASGVKENPMTEPARSSSNTAPTSAGAERS